MNGEKTNGAGIVAGLRPARRVCRMIAFASLLFGSLAAAHAEPWQSVGKWVIAGTPQLGGCAMATTYPHGGFISLTVVADEAGAQNWELLISEEGWRGIASEKMYPVDLFFDDQRSEGLHITMRGYKTPPGSHMITNALVFDFLGESEIDKFIADGFARDSQMVLSAGGRRLSALNLEDHGAARDELLKCFAARAQFGA